MLNRKIVQTPLEGPKRPKTRGRNVRMKREREKREERTKENERFTREKLDLLERFTREKIDYQQDLSKRSEIYQSEARFSYWSMRKTGQRCIFMRSLMSSKGQNFHF